MGNSQVPKEYADFTKQLCRAVCSIPVNIADGVGKTSEVDQNRFSAIARGHSRTLHHMLQVFSHQLLIRCACLLRKLVAGESFH